jgi:hypothetical protein
MNEIFYQGGMKFVLTDEETKAAVEVFNNRQTYYCKRLDSFLSPYFLVIRPEEEKDICFRRIL